MTLYVENGVTTDALPLLRRDELEMFTSSPQINPKTQYARAGTRVNMDDVVDMGTRTYVGVGDGMYVTCTKTANAQGVTCTLFQCSFELAFFILLVGMYIACVFWPVTAVLLIVAYALVKLRVVGRIMRWWTGCPGLTGFTITGPTGEIHVEY